MSDVLTDARPFDVCGPLPTGVTVLEASAGTGKTYTIAGLAARYVAEGTPLDKLLLVTFTRMATGERFSVVVTEYCNDDATYYVPLQAQVSKQQRAADAVARAVGPRPGTGRAADRGSSGGCWPAPAARWGAPGPRCGRSP